MTAASLGAASGIFYPFFVRHTDGFAGANATLDAVGEKSVFIGRENLEGGPGSKTISSAGGKIEFSTGTVTWATAGTTLRVGIADVDLANGPPARDDGTHDVYKDWVQGTDALSGTTWTSFAMATGTKTITHGDLIAVVCEITVRNGSDSVVVQGYDCSAPPGIPICTKFTGGAWSATANMVPNVIIIFDDGTLGCIAGGTCFDGTSNSTNFNSGSAIDERACIFQVPGPVTVDRLFAFCPSSVAGSDFEIILYSTPLGTPSVIEAVTVDSNTMTSSNGAPVEVLLTTVRQLSANTDYAVAIRPTTTNNVRLNHGTFSNANYRKFYPGGTNTRLGTRADQTGAFTETTTQVPFCGVGISAIDDGAGGAGGLLVHPGMAGGMRG